MRKSLALALALVFAIASVSFAATPSVSVEFSATGKYEDEEQFFGDYTLEAGLDVTVSIESEEDNWDASFSLDALDGANLGRYTVNVNEDAFALTAWGGATTDNIGDRGDALGFVTVSGKYTTGTKFRVTTNVGGVDAAAQVQSGATYFNGEMDFEEFTLGATVARMYGGTAYNKFAVYGGADLGVANVDAAFASTGEAEKDNTAMGVKASSDITEQLSVEASYVTSGDNWDNEDDAYSVGATFTEGLFQAGADYTRNVDTTTTEYDVSVVYRGSEDNVAFDDLFESDEYFNNVAPAFGFAYNLNQKDGAKATTTITVKGTAPVVADQLWVLGSVEAKSNEDGIETDVPASGATAASTTTVKVEGYAPFGKLTFLPSVTSASYTDVEAGTETGTYSTLDVALDVEYAVADDVTLSFEIGQETGTGSGDFEDDSKTNRYSGFGVTVSF